MGGEGGGGGLSKKGVLGQFADLKGGLARKRGVVFLRGVDTPIHTMSMNLLFLSLRKNFQGNMKKKQKDSLETWAVLLIFSLEPEISGVAVQSIHQNSEK